MYIMEPFLFAIINDWHVFSQTKLLNIFRNIFIIYNRNIDTSLEDLKQLYGLQCITNNYHLSNDLEYAKKDVNIIYLHQCKIERKQLEEFIEEMDGEEYTYKEAYKKLQDLYEVEKTEDLTEDNIFQQTKMTSYIAKRESDMGYDKEEEEEENS